jgi:hypothetical protein
MNRSVRGLDYSFGRPNLSTVKAQGYKFVLRYLTGHGKALSGAERRDIEAHKLGLGVVFESSANRAGQGRAAGASDARTAQWAVTTVGLPATLPIYFAVDFDADPGQVAPYFQGIRNVLPFDRTGVYGGYRVVSALAGGGVVKWVWQTVAWSGGKVYPGAHIFQHAPSIKVGGADVDVNDASPEAFGSLHGGPKPPKPRKYGSRALVQGHQGEDVRQFQVYLSKVSAPFIAQDGDYGPATERAKHDAMFKLGWSDAQIRSHDKSKSIGKTGLGYIKDPAKRPKSFKDREKQRRKK